MKGRSDSLRVLKELSGAPPQSRAKAPPRPSAARLPQYGGGTSSAAMSAKVEHAKRSSSDIEARLRSLKGGVRAQKAQSVRTIHQRDWLRQDAELKRERSELEKAHVLWSHTHTAVPAASCGATSSGSSTRAGGEPSLERELRELLLSEGQLDEARREWSIEMRSQLRDLRELCTATVRQPVPARMLMRELGASLGAQASQLSDKAAALEEELHHTSARLLAPDEDGGGSAPTLAEPEDIAALSGAYVTPEPLRSDGERRLLEALGGQLREEGAKHARELRALRQEFSDVLAGTGGAPTGDGGGGDDDGSDGSDGGECDGGGGGALLAGEYEVLLAPSEEAGPPGGESREDEPSVDAATDAADGRGSDKQPHAATGDGAIGEDGLVRLAMLEKALRGRPRAALLERVAMEMPTVATQEVERALVRLERRRRYAAHRRGLVAAWEARRQALARSARQLLQEQAAAEGKLLLREREAALLRAHREELRVELELLEAARGEREEEERAQAAERAAMEASLAEAKRRKDQAAHAHKKALVERYRGEKHAAAEEEAARAEAELACAEAARLAQAERNLERVLYRAEQLRARQLARAEVEEQARRLGEEAERRLMRVRDAALERMNVTADPQRAVAPTAASGATAQPRVELFRATGYAEATLMKDMRYKLSLALSNAGLRGTEYGRNVLTSARLGAPLRPDAIETQIKLG